MPPTPSSESGSDSQGLQALAHAEPDAVLGQYRLVDQTLLFVRDGEVAGALPVAGMGIEHSRGRNVVIPLVMAGMVLFSASCGFIPWLMSGEISPGPSACCAFLSPLLLIGFGLTLLRWNDVTVRQWLIMTLAGGQTRQWRLPADVKQADADAFVEAVREAAARPPKPAPDVPEGKAWVLMDSEVQIDPDAALVDWSRPTSPADDEVRQLWGRVGDAHIENPRLRPDILGLAYYGNRLVSVAQVSYEDPQAVRDWLGGQHAVVIVPGPTALDHQLRVLLSAAGLAQDPDSLPPANTQAIRRRRHTVARLTDEGYPVIGAQPYQEEPRLQSPEAVARRAVCLGLIVGPLAAGAAQGAPLPALDELPNSLTPFVPNLTPAETAFLRSPEPRVAGALQWRMEGSLVLLWALGLVDGPLSVSDQTDGEAVMAAAERLGVLGTEEPGLIVPELRDIDEIYARMDELYCRHWTSVDDRVNQRNPAARPHHPGLVYEQLYALCWLTGFLNEPDMTWDSVQIST